MKKLLLPFFLIGSIAMMVVMAKTGASLKTTATPLGILDLEFAYTTAKTASVLKAWTPDNIAPAKVNTYFDFLFLFFYSFFLFFACKKISENYTGPVAKAGNFISKGALLAGFLDVLENAGMLISLNGHDSSSVAFGTTFFSVIKWVLAIIAVLCLLTGLLNLAFRKLKSIS